ncbi:MAG: GNAT family N-acetyltransferase [Candidatus Paceibacterota bacterium]|jgi:ribosomal protein S18 acetylase RimI-like enzyme
MDLKVKRYNPKDGLPKELIGLVREKYGHQENFDYFLNDFVKAFSFCVKNKNICFVPIAIYSGDKVKAHGAIIKDYRTELNEAFLGFFECLDDYTVFNSLWEELKVLAKEMGVSLIKGPVNGSIWHQYRAIRQTDGSPFFKSEMMCESYYYDLFLSKNPQVEIKYHSGYRENFSAIINAGRLSYEKFIGAGFSIQEIEIIDKNILGVVVDISRKVFSNSWGLTDLSDDEFLDLYSGEKIKSNLNKLYLLQLKDKIIGFSIILKENDSTIIFKTIAVLPEYLGLGLGNALAYKVHLDAERDGVKRIIYALVNEDNNVKNFPKDDAVIFRKYSSFEFLI